jgi:hypothetical protein
MTHRTGETARESPRELSLRSKRVREMSKRGPKLPAIDLSQEAEWLESGQVTPCSDFVHRILRAKMTEAFIDVLISTAANFG